METVAVFGAGVAGLTVAHELSRRGYSVTVYETNAEPGGFFRSARARQGNLPTEYSWHGLGPWYHNVFDLMKQIPFDETGSVFDRALSRPLDYGIAPDRIAPRRPDRHMFRAWHMFRMSLLDRIRWGWMMLKTWASNRRAVEAYALRNAAEAWRPTMSELGWKTWRATFGPWVGSDWTRVSLHHVGQFFRKNLMSGDPLAHPADEQGAAWSHGSGDGWLLLRGPSNEVWFDPWIRCLEKNGVRFCWNEALTRLDLGSNGKITRAHLASGARVEADHYVLAMTPFACADVIERTPGLAALDELRSFRPLVQDGPHTQVSFRIAFAEKIAWPHPRSALVIADSEFNLTLFAEEQAWRSDIDLGDGVQSLWTGTACAGTVPGRLFGLPVERCTKEQFLAEVRAQLAYCEGLDFLLREANHGCGLADFRIVRMEIWHEWMFSPDGIVPRQPKWVNTTHTQPFQPGQVTPVPNLLLAGAHTRTSADLWSIEAAVESGRLAARAIDPGIRVLHQFKPWWLRALSALADLAFGIGAPHLLDVALAILVLLIGAGVAIPLVAAASH
jgi:hypothetical protein